MRWKVGLVAALLLLVAGLGFAWPWGRGKALCLPGTVEIHEVRLGPRVAGRVKTVYVTEGAQVQAGDPIVELDVADLQARRGQMAAKLALAEAEHLKAKNGPRPEEKAAARAAADAAKERWMRLKKGFRDEEIAQAESEHNAARVDAQLAQEELDRAQRLRGTAVSKAEYDVARAAFDRSRARLATAKAKLDLVRAGSRPEEVAEAEAEYRRMKETAALLEETRREDVLAAAAREEEARAALAEMDVNLREAVVRAKEPCVVEIVGVRVGDLVAAHQPVARVLRTGDLWVKTYVPETELGKVRLNQPVKVTMDSYPGRPFDGRVVFIGAESEFTPRNVQTIDERRHQLFGVRVKVDDPKGHFKSGMAAEVIIPVE